MFGLINPLPTTAGDTMLLVSTAMAHLRLNLDEEGLSFEKTEAELRNDSSMCSFWKEAI